MKYGIELEFFVADSEDSDYLIVPAYKATSNLDGNPIIGEIRTVITDNITDCIFDLQKKLFEERESLKEKGFNLLLTPEIKVDNDFLLSLRKDKAYVSRKHTEVLEELSIYPTGKVSKMLQRGLFKASLQINFSKNDNIYFDTYEKIEIEDKYKYISKPSKKSYASLFNYLSPILKLDTAFEKEITRTKRVKGVYAIKEGELGDRIEYRSLPNDVDQFKIIKTLQGA